MLMFVDIPFAYQSIIECIGLCLNKSRPKVLQLFSTETIHITLINAHSASTFHNKLYILRVSDIHVLMPKTKS